MAVDLREEYDIELPLLVREKSEGAVFNYEEPDLTDNEAASQPVRKKKEVRAEKTRSGKKVSSRKVKKSKERRQAEEDWKAYLKGETPKEETEKTVRKSGSRAGRIILLVLGILAVIFAAALTYAFIAFYLPLVRNGVSFKRLFKSMLLFIGIPWLAAIILLVFALTIGRRK